VGRGESEWLGTLTLPTLGTLTLPKSDDSSAEDLDALRAEYEVDVVENDENDEDARFRVTRGSRETLWLRLKQRRSWQFRLGSAAEASGKVTVSKGALC